MKIKNIDPMTENTLRGLEAEGMSLQTVLRKAVWLYYSLRHEAQQGNEIVIRDSQGRQTHATSRFLEDS